MMSRRHGSWMGTALLLGIVAIWFLPSLRGVMHESDQAALLDGAWQMSHGRAPLAHPGFYNYDKLFFTYWLLATVFRLLQTVLAFDPVAVGNVVSCVVFSASVVRAGCRGSASASARGLLCATLLAPAFVLHAPYLAAAFLSGGFLLFLFHLLAAGRLRATPAELAAIAGLSFAAVGSRADAVLVLPLICWLTLWPRARPWRLFARRQLWAAVAGALGALILGKMIGNGDDVYGYAPVFNPRVVAAFTVFGLGGGAVVFAYLSACLTLAAARTRSWTRLSWTFGVLWLWLPFGYYLLQLFSTRYWVPGLLGMVIFLSSRRGAALVALSRRRSPARFHLARGGALLLAIAPLCLGIALPFPASPRLTLSQATLFPTADGSLPMGAYLSFLSRSPGSAAYVPDQNQAIWLAAKSAEFEPNAQGRVPILPTPMFEVLYLACHLRGYEVEDQRTEPGAQPFYMDLRGLVKLMGDMENATHLLDLGTSLLAGSRLEEVSPRVRGTSVLKLTPASHPAPDLNARWKAFRAVFRGDDFQVYPFRQAVGTDHRLDVPLREGRTIAIADGHPFRLTATHRDGSTSILYSASPAMSWGQHRLVLDGRQADLAGLRAEDESPTDEAEIAESALPDYMSVRQLAK